MIVSRRSNGRRDFVLLLILILILQECEMSEAIKVTITMLKGEFIAPEWREEGTVHEVPKEIADAWIAHGSAVLGGNVGDRPKTGTSSHDLGEFPSAALFAAAGFTSLDAVKELIADKGDAWPKSVKGMNKSLAAKVSEALEAMALESETKTAESTEEGSEG